MSLSLLTLAMSKKYTNDIVVGLGDERIIKGASCTIKNITKENNANIVTFEWTAENGQKETKTMTIEDGTSISSLNVNNENELVITLNDGTVLNSGAILTGAVPIREF